MPELNPKIFNANKDDYSVPEIILGQDPGLLDSVHNHFPEIFKIYKRLKKLDWDELEFDYASCNTEFKTCDRSTYDMMIKTIAWQWEADSVASRSIVNVLSNVVTDSRVWAGYVRINDNEDVHALSYSEAVRGSFDNPNEILTEILRVKEAQARMHAVADVMARAHRASHEYALGLRENDQALYNDVFMFLVALYFLERIQFMASFAVTFAIGKTGAFQPIVRMVTKIAQDEYEIHSQFGQEVLRSLLRTERGRAAYEQCKRQMVALLWEILKTEVVWVKYLFSEGRELTGMNETKLINWVLFNVGFAGNFLELIPDLSSQHGQEFLEMTGMEFVIPYKNPLPYMASYMDISDSQASPQEEKQTGQYMVNLLDTKDEEEVFDFDM